MLTVYKYSTISFTCNNCHKRRGAERLAGCDAKTNLETLPTRSPELPMGTDGTYNTPMTQNVLEPLHTVGPHAKAQITSHK